MFFLGIDFSWLIITLKILGSLLSVAFIVGIILSLIGILDTGKKKKEKRDNYFITYNDKVSNEGDRWLQIKDYFQSRNSTDWRMAIIDADSMLDDLITSMGYDAPTLGEKLKLLDNIHFPLIDSAWHVHKLRNTLAHKGTNYNLSEREAYQAFKIYEKIFYENNYIS